MKSFRLGLKLYSTDTALACEAQKRKAEGLFDFVELYIVPDSYGSTIETWQTLDIPFVIHSPHSYHGTNFAQEDKWEINAKNFAETQHFADKLAAEIIIIHGGNNGSVDELIRQIRLLNEKRIVLENKPKLGTSNKNKICVGWSPSEFYRVKESGVLYGTALDIGHAIYAAKAAGVEPMDMISEFMKFDPKIYHLTNGYTSSERDIHLNLDKGDFDLAKLISVIPHNSLVTLETPRQASNGLNDFEGDVVYLRGVLKSGAFLRNDCGGIISSAENCR